MPGIFYSITFQEIASWPHPNYKDPEERTWLAPFAIAWCAVTTFFVFARIILKLQKRAGNFGLDDFLIFVAWVFGVVVTVLACVSVWRLDIGRHIWDVRPENYQPALYVGWLAQVMFIFSTGAMKCSVLVFYCRMVKGTYSKRWTYILYVLLFLTIGSWVGGFLSYCFMCFPLSTFWNLEAYLAGESSSYRCINGDDLTIAIGVITIASDFWTAAVPCALFQYHDLGLPRKQKIMLNLIFCLGFLVTGVGIARTYYLWEIGHHEDLSWIGYDLFATGDVELQLGIICTCAPFLRALIRKYLPDFTNFSHSTPITAASNVATNLSNLSNRVRHSINRNSMASTWRQSVTVRGSYIQELKDMPFTPIDDIVMEEKTGCLVREEATGRLVYSAHKPSPSVSSLTNISTDEK